MSEEHTRLRESLGAFALGQLSAGEAAEVERHLASCAECRGELAELAPAAAVLREARSGHPDTPPPWLEERLLGSVREERSRARRTSLARRALACAAAVVALAGAGAVGSWLDPEPPAGAPREPVSVAVSAPGVQAEAALITHTWGTELVLRATGVPAGAYTVSMLDAAGEAVAAGSFLGTEDRVLTCNLNAAVARADAEQALVYDSRGEVVLTASL